MVDLVTSISCLLDNVCATPPRANGHDMASREDPIKMGSTTILKHMCTVNDEKVGWRGISCR